MGLRLLQPRRLTAKKALFMAGFGLLAVAGLGSGAYAALGGTNRVQSTTETELQRGLVSMWKMDGNAKDSTPNANNGVVTGGTLSSDRKGAANKAYSLSGSSQYISVPYAAVTHPTLFSASAWIMPTNRSVTGVQSILSTTEAGGFNLQVSGSNAVSNCSANLICATVFIGGTAYAASSTASVLSNNTWTHIAVTYDGTAIRLFVNGTQTSSNFRSGTVSYTNNNALCIGAEAGAATCNGGQNFPGSIDDVRVYNRPLTTNEVGFLYSQYDASTNVANGLNGIVGQWKFDGNALDSSPNANNGTVTGASLAVDRKATANAAYSFNGTNSTYITVPDNAVLNSTTATWSIWFKPSSFPPGSAPSAIMEKHSSSSSFLGAGIYVRSDGRIKMELKNASAGTSVNSTDPVALNAWHHIVIQMNGSGTAYLYVDNALQGSMTPLSDWSFGSGTIMKFGASTDSFYLGLNGAVDDARVYNRAMTTTEIAALYASYNGTINLQAAPNTVGSNFDSGLAAYWPLNGNVKDVTPYSINGTINGATVATDRKNRTSTAYGFDGTSGYIDFGSPTTLPTGLQPRTICAWAYSGNTDAVDRVIMAYGSPANNQGMVIGRNGTTLYGGSFGQDVVSSAAWTAATWNLVCLTYNGSTATLHLNGNTVGTLATNSWSLVQSGLRIGRHLGGGTSYWSGSVDDARVYNRALTASEVFNLYNSYR